MVRALRPSAMALVVLVTDGGKIDVKPVHEGGLFSAVVPQAAAGYRLESTAQVELFLNTLAR